MFFATEAEKQEWIDGRFDVLKSLNADNEAAMARGDMDYVYNSVYEVGSLIMELESLGVSWDEIQVRQGIAS